MKATVNKTALTRAAGACERAVSQKTSLPILSGLLLEVKDGRLDLAGTDLEVSLRCSCPVTDAEDGRIAVNADAFGKVIAGLPGQTVSFTLSEDRATLHVKSGRSNYKVPTLVADEFPPLPDVEPGKGFVTTNAELLVALGRVVSAAALDDTRPIICGVQWSVEGTRLRLVATDTHRLHVTTLDVEEPDWGEFAIIIGRRACTELLKLLPTADKPSDVCTVTVGFSEAQDENSVPVPNIVEVCSTWGVFTARLTEGVFPKWERVVPSYSSRLVVEKKALTEAVKRAGVVAEGNAGRVLFAVEDGSLRLTARSEEFGESDEAVDILDVSEDGDPLALSYKVLLPALAAVPDETLNLRRGASLQPVYLQGDDEKTFFAVLMPMQL